MILVIDDSDTQRALIREMLEGGGYEVCEAAGGQEGLKLALDRRPALILCDLMMPDKDGFETVRDLLKRIPDAKIIAISGVLFGAADHATMAGRLGLVAVIEKPFRQAQLLDVVRETLGE